LQKKLTNRGWQDLTHQKIKLKINGVVIEARGTDDAHLELDIIHWWQERKVKLPIFQLG
jgi:uncharacterized protein YehS (DUF1456 family)